MNDLVEVFGGINKDQPKRLPITTSDGGDDDSALEAPRQLRCLIVRVTDAEVDN